jgi:hypothetical protein
MQTKPFPEIVSSDLKAVRDFLAAGRDESRGGPRAPRNVPTAGGVPLRNGIARARMRSTAKPGL